MVWHDLWLNPGFPDHWQTLYPLGQWAGSNNEISKYKDLEIEIGKMWRLKTITVPVIMRALGIIKKTIDKHINKIPGCPSPYEIKKNCIYVTEKYHSKKAAKNINPLNGFTHFRPWEKTWRNPLNGFTHFRPWEKTWRKIVRKQK